MGGYKGARRIGGVGHFNQPRIPSLYDFASYWYIKMFVYLKDRKYFATQLSADPPILFLLNRSS